MKSYCIHVLYEHGADLAPHSCSHIRLLRPLSHPSLAPRITLTAGLEYEGQAVDAVIVDRLWRPDISLTMAQQLLVRVRNARARFIYAIDDDFFELQREHKDWQPTEEQLRVLAFFLRQADGVMVSTELLKQRLAAYNPRIALLPNMLDERLLDAQRCRPAIHLALRCTRWVRRQAARQPVVIGYMGTATHDTDLQMILPALRAVCQRHAGTVAIEIIGVIAHPATLTAVAGLPLRFISPEYTNYPDFLTWFSKIMWWDIALAPLQQTAFNDCKSDIKFLDYSAISAAGIYSRVPAYAASVQHRRTGWLADDSFASWEDALETLLAHPIRRLWLGYHAHHYLHHRRALAGRAADWLTALDAFLAA